MEFDLRHLWGMDLWEVLDTPALSWERLGRFLRQLPADAATWRSVHGAEQTVWTLDRHLAASTVDALRVANWQRSEGKPKDRPRPIPRPGAEPSVTTIGDASRFTPAEAKALLDSRKPPRSPNP